MAKKTTKKAAPKKTAAKKTAPAKAAAKKAPAKTAAKTAAPKTDTLEARVARLEAAIGVAPEPMPGPTPAQKKVLAGEPETPAQQKVHDRYPDD